MNRRPALDSPRYVAALGVVAVALAGWYAGRLDGGLWLDEVIYARAAWSTVHGNPYVNPTHMFAPAGRYAVAAGQLLVGPTPVGSRAALAVVGVATVAATYALGARVSGPAVGLAAAATLGLTPLFARHATTAMLDLPLVLGVVALLLAVARDRPTAGYAPALVGACTVWVCASKSYGVVYAVGPLVAYGLAARRVGDRRAAVRSVLGPWALGAAAAFALLYLPYALVDHPDYYAGAAVPGFARAVFALPAVGNVAYAFAAAVIHNLTGHSGAGGSPLAFLGWLWSTGGAAYVVGSAAAIAAVRGDRRRRTVALAVLVPLAVVALLPKAYPRYLLPLFPAGVVLGFDAAARAAERLVRETNADDVRVTVARFDAAALARGAALCLLLLATVGPALAAGPAVGVDSGYDRVAGTLRAEADDGGSVSAVAEHPLVLKWHLGDKYAERYYFDPTAVGRYPAGDGSVRVVGVSPLRPESAERAAAALGDGTPDYVVDDAALSTPLDALRANASCERVAVVPRTVGGATTRVVVSRCA